MQTTPWHNYALILYLADRADEINLGKTKLQKLIFFLNEQQCRENMDFLLERIKDLKPQFGPSEIEAGIDQLISFDYLAYPTPPITTITQACGVIR